MFLYFCEMISAWTFLAVSVAHPTRIRTEVPANPLNAVKWVICSTTAGPAARTARNADPRTDIRPRTWRVFKYYINWWWKTKMLSLKKPRKERERILRFWWREQCFYQAGQEGWMHLVVSIVHSHRPGQVAGKCSSSWRKLWEVYLLEDRTNLQRVCVWSF